MCATDILYRRQTKAVSNLALKIQVLYMSGKRHIFKSAEILVHCCTAISISTAAKLLSKWRVANLNLWGVQTVS